MVNRSSELAESGQTWLEKHQRMAVLANLTARVIKVQGAQRASLAAAGAAFWLIIALFPAIIAVVNIFGLVIDQQQVAKSVENLTSTAHGTVGESIAKQLSAIGNTSNTTLTIGLIVSISIALYSVSTGAYSLGRAVQLSYGLPPMNYLRARLRAFAAAIVGVIGFGILGFGATARIAIDNKLNGFWQGAARIVIQIPLTLLVMTAIFVGLYRFGVGRKVGLKALLPGACLASVAVFLVTVGSSLLIAVFGTEVSIYGAAAGVVSALVAVYLAMYIIVIGAIINSQLRPIDMAAKDAVTHVAV